MYPALSIASPIWGDIVLDPHAIPFFAPHHHVGKAQVRLRLGVRGLEKHIFLGRLAQLVTREWVGVIQNETFSIDGEASGDTFSLVLDNVTAPAFSGEPSEAQIEEFWAQQLTPKVNTLPTFRGTFWRPYYSREHSLHLALQLRTSGECHLLDLRQPTAQEDHTHAHRFRIDLGKDWLAMATSANLRFALAAIETAVFAKEVDTIMSAPGDRLYHTLQLYNLDEDAQCVDVLGLPDETRREIHALMRSLIHYEMQPGRRLAGYSELTWPPMYEARLWRNTSFKGRHRNCPPRWLQKYLKEVCALFQYFPKQLPCEGNHYAELVRHEWARDLKIQLHEPSAHEIANAIANIQAHKPPSFKF